MITWAHCPCEDVEMSMHLSFWVFFQSLCCWVFIKALEFFLVYKRERILIKASFLSTWLSGSLTRLQLHLTSWRFDLSCHLPTYPLTRRNPIFIPLLLQLDSFWKNNFYVTYGIIQFSIWIIIYLDILVGGTNYCNDLRNNYLGHISKLKINYF